MTLLDFLALILAGGAVIDVWFNGTIFAGWLAFYQVKAENGPAPPPDTTADVEEEIAAEPLPPLMRLADKILSPLFAQLLTCPFCMSYHAPFWLAVAFFVPAAFVSEPWDVVCKLPVYCLAATRLGNILNGLLPAQLRYERR